MGIDRSDRRAAVFVATALACAVATLPTRASAPLSGFSETVVFSGLTKPTAVRFSPDGRVFVAQKNGMVKVFDDLSDASATTVIDVSTLVQDFWDRGLLGLALHPDFPQEPYVYLLYTWDYNPATGQPWGDTCEANPGATTDGCPVSGRLSRFEVTPANTVVGGEQVLIENQWCQQFPSHSIGGLTFGAEGALYASAGDGGSFNRTDWGQLGGTLTPVITPANPCADPNRAYGTATVKPGAEGGALRSQDVRTSADAVSYDGAVLRVDPATGAAWPGNPLIGGATGDDPIVAYGLRNPFRITRRPGTNEIWIGDVGWSSREEINRMVSADDTLVDNFGWPCYEGTPRQSGYDGENLTLCESLYTPGDTNVVAPYFNYAHGTPMYTGDTCATGSSSTSGLAFYTGGTYPASYDGALFFADYSRDCIFVMFEGANGDPDTATRTVFVRPGGSPSTQPNPVDLQIGPGGDLFYADIDGGAIRRIQYVTGNQAPTASIQAAPTDGPVPLLVHFDGSGSTDPNPGATLFYDWDLDGDGQYDDSAIVNPSFTYNTPGTVQVGLRVTDDDGASDTDVVSISVGNTAPTATILTPSPSLTWHVGEAIDFSGEGNDLTDGALGAAAMSWELVLYHCPGGTTDCHPHGLQTFPGVDGGQFTAPDHEYYSYLELTLRVTDSGGLTGEATARLDPETVLLGYATNPSGLEISVAGVNHAAPFDEPAIVGSSVPLVAPSPQALGGQSYYWVSWSDGGDQSRTVIAGDLPQTFTANFAPCVAVESACDGYDEDCNGTVDDVPAPTGAVTLDLSLTELSWNSVSGAQRYDVVRGSLTQLHAAGDFAAATEECLAGDWAGTTLGFAADPPPDEGYWFLARPKHCGGAGSYDSGGAGQAASRDAGIAASGAACP